MSRVSYLRVLVVFFGGLFVTLASAKSTIDLDQISRQEISERIAPVGTVCQEGEECANAAGVEAASTSSGPRTGEAIFNQYCTACHTTGLLGAPIKGDVAAWEAKEKEAGGFSKMLSNAINGIKGMPPKGTCMNCSDEEISIAIEYMSGLKAE